MARGRAGALLAAAMCVAVAAATADAQTGGWTDVDVARVATSEEPVRFSNYALSIAPSLRSTWRGFNLTNDGSFTASDRRHLFLQNSAVVTRQFLEYRGLVLESGVGVSGLIYRTASSISSVGADEAIVVPIARALMQMELRGRADLAVGRWGFSLSGNAGENFFGAVHRPVGVEASVTRELRHVLLYFSARGDRFRQTPASQMPGRPSPYVEFTYDTMLANAARVYPLFTVNGGATIAFGRAEIVGDAGVRRTSHYDMYGGEMASHWGELWCSVLGTYRLTSHTLLRAGMGTYPTDFIRQLPSGGYASLGVRFEQGKRQQVDWYRPPELPAFRVDTLPGGARVLRLRAPRALSVELSGDFTDWTPVPMRPLRGGNWELVLPIAPGTYRVSVRVDGGSWAAPPGLVPVADEFNGEVAVIVIR